MIDHRNGGTMSDIPRWERDDRETFAFAPERVTQSIEVMVTRRSRVCMWLARKLAGLLELAIASAGIPCRVTVDIDEERADLDKLAKIPGVTK